MKTLLLKVFLVSCVLFLGIKDAQAATRQITVIALPVANLNASPINKDLTNAAIFGFQLKNTSTGNNTGTVDQISITGNGTLSTYMPTGYTLYSYTAATFPGTALATPLVNVNPAPNSTTGTINYSFPALTKGTTSTLYYFIVANSFPDNVTGANDDFQLTVNATDVTQTGTWSFVSDNGPDYTISSPVTLGTATTTGLATSPLSTNQLAAGILGFSVTTTQSKTFSQFNFAASTADGDIANYQLYSSTTNSFASAMIVTGASFSGGGTTAITVSGLTQTINGSPVYYFVKADITPSTAATYRLSLTGAVSGVSTYTNGANIQGTNYTITAPVTLGVTLATGLATGTLTSSTTNQGLLGFSVTTTGSQTFTSFQFTATQPIGTYFTNLKLYSCTTNNYSTGTKTLLATVTGAALNTTALTISGFTAQTISSATKYYFVVADYTVASSASVSFELDATTASTSTYNFTNGGPISGSSLTLTSATYNWVGNTATGGLYLWSTPANWSPATVPGGYDIAKIGITNYTSSHNPTINTAASVGAVNFGTNNGNTISVTANAALTIAGDMTLQSDDNGSGYQYVNLSGAGPVSVTNVNIIDNSDLLNDNFDLFDEYNYEILNTTLTNFNISGNVNLTSIYDYIVFFGVIPYEYNAALEVTGGTTTISGTGATTGVINSTNQANAYSYVIVQNATLNLNNPNALSGLSATGLNEIEFNNTGALVKYTGASPTIYTSNAPNVDGGVSYKDITINGTGTATTESGTLTVSDNFTNSSNTNLATNSTIVSVTNQLIPTAGTLTCGSSTLTAGSMLFSGGNLTAGSGTVTCNGTYVNNGGSFNCGTAANASVYFKNTYTNNSGTFTANPASTSSVYFTGANQTLQDNTTAGTTLNNVTISGTNTAISVSTGAAGTGNFAIANTGTLTMAANSKLTAGSGSSGGAGYLTLLSTSSSTASVAQIPTTSSIVGAVNVQRSITGGTGTRGYRLLSSPVNISTNAAGAGNLSLAYLNTNASFGGVTYPGALTMGPGTGFTVNGSTNPIIYIYDETRTTNNTGFTTGKNIGIYSIGSTTVTTLSGTTQAAAAIPVGNSYLLYYVGNNTSTVVANTRVPDNTVVTATGYINQGGTTGTIPVKFWKLGTTPIPYDINGAALPGINQVGNPFPCTISLNQLSADNTAISKVFWELVPGGSYVSYSAATGHPVSDARASNYIVSGQGFLIQAQGTGETLTFKEGEKVSPYPSGLVSPFNTATSTALLMSLPTKPGINTDVTAQSITAPQITASAIAAPANLDTAMQAYLATRPSPSLIGLHLQITKDSVHYVQTGIYFNNTINNDNYSQNNDAINVNGSDAQVFLSSYSADNVSLGINQLSEYTKGKRIKLYTAASSTGLYNISLADIANIDTGMYNIYLVDKKMNDSLDMVRYRSYAFNITNTDTTTYGANRFVLAIERKALPPYQLIKFAGQKVSTGVQLTWQTLNEGDYTGFALQKLTNGNTYNTIYTLQSNSSSNYSYIDKHPLTGKNTYKLQQTDINGKVTYSSPVTINYDSKSPNGNMTVYPNPSKSIITVSLDLNATASDYIADIYNTSGTIILHKVVKANTWTQDISSYKLGVYIIEVKTNNGDLVGKSKFVKIN